jgi:hypothetical protein
MEVQCSPDGREPAPYHPSMDSRVHVVFSKPGFMWNNPRLIVRLDSADVYDSKFKLGVDVTQEAAAGSHNVSTRIEFMGVSRNREYAVTVAPDTDLTVTLRYSRLWGNFSRRPELSST